MPFGRRGGGGRRSAARTTAPLLAVLTTVTRSHPAILMDVSSTGARVRGSDLPGKGVDVVIRIDAVRAFAKVVWSNRGQCGLAFYSPITTADVDHLRARACNVKVPGLTPQQKAALEEWKLGISR
jgi:hypothetical protein